MSLSAWTPELADIASQSVNARRLFGNTEALEVLLEGADLDGHDTLAVEQGRRAPVLGLDTGQDAGVAREALGLGDAPGVAHDDVLLLALADRGPAEDRVGVVGDEVATAVPPAVAGVRPGYHGADGAAVDAAPAHEPDEVARLVLVRHVVLGLAPVDLRHRLHRVALEQLRHVDMFLLALAADGLPGG